MAKRKVTQREGHPGWRLPGILSGKSVRRGRAFRAGSCPREKASPSLASPAARLDRPRLTAVQGPRKSGCASCAPEATATAERRELAAHRSPSPACRGGLGWGSCFCALGARCATRGPYGAAGGGRKVLRMARRDASQFFAGTGVPSKSPATHPRTRKAGCLEGAPSGCRSLWLLSLGHARESDSGAGRRPKPLCR